MFNTIFIIFSFLLFLFIIAWTFFILSNLITSLIIKVPNLSSKKVVIEKIKNDPFFLNIFLSNRVFYDLGCGYATVVYELCRKFNCKGRGYEINPAVVLIANFRKFFYPAFIRKNVKIIRENIFNINLRKADIIFLYLLPVTVERLEEKIRKECKKGTFIICNSFGLKNYKAIWEHKSKGKLENIYVYKI